MTSNFKVYVVEDDPLLRDMFEMMLAEECDVEVFPDAESCLERTQSEKPGMFLLDVGLPGMSGLDMCRQLKSDAWTSEVPVTFVSGVDDIDSRLAGYDAGGEDFICKPFDPSELMRKITRIRHTLEEKQQLKDMAGYAQHTAFVAMSSMSELGVVIEYMRKSFACTEEEDLASLILQTLGQYSLQGAVQVRSGDFQVTVSLEGINLPLEVSVLHHVRTQGRIFEFKNRGVYNYGGVTLMVKDMPLQDQERCGRLRDNLAILTEGADARRQSIVIERSNRQTRDGIGVILADLHATLIDLQTSQSLEQQVTSSIMVEMQQAMIQAFMSMGLTEKQEEQLTLIVRYYFDSLQDHNEYGYVLLNRLGQVADRLKSLT